MADRVQSENVLGEKFDHCVSDALVKTVAGLGLGIVFSVTFFRRRPWPVAFGTGIGIGMAYSNCQHEIMNVHNIPGKFIKLRDGRQTPATDT